MFKFAVSSKTSRMGSNALSGFIAHADSQNSASRRAMEKLGMRLVKTYGGRRNRGSVEERMEFDIDGIPFVGYIDFLGELDGEYYIIDNKSRALKPRSGRAVPTKKDIELDEMLVQLYIYAAAVKQKYGKFPKALCFNCFRNGVFIEEPFVLDKYYKVISWVKENIEIIKQESDFSPWLDYFACTYICGYSDDCCYWQERG